MDVESSINPTFLTRVNRSMGYAFCLGKVGVDTGAVGTKNCVSVYQMAQPLPYVTCVELLQFEVCLLTTAISYHQHRNLLSGQAASLGTPASLTRWAEEVSLTLEGLQEKGFIRLDNA